MAAVRSCAACQRCARFSSLFLASSKFNAASSSHIFAKKYSTEPLPSPSSTTAEKTYPPHISNIVESISKLNLLEVSSLNELLKSRLNIQDAPVMMSGPMITAAPAVAQEEEAPVVAQTEFTVKLLKFDEAKKVKLIKEIKSIMTDINLVQAKKFVESTPQIIKEKLSKEDAEKLKVQLEAVGATLEIE